MGGSILVVEDEAAIRDLLAANLQRAGYKVMCAGDVPQAEALVRDTRPDLVLLDWVLPGVPSIFRRPTVPLTVSPDVVSTSRWILGPNCSWSVTIHSPATPPWAARAMDERPARIAIRRMVVMVL